MRIARALALIAVAALAFGGCSDDDEPSSASATTTTTVAPAAVVEMKGVKFTPETVTVKAGETVEWQFNDGSTSHQVHGATFDSEVQSSGTFTHTFDQAGTSTYQCSIHPEQMKGIVVVQ